MKKLYSIISAVVLVASSAVAATPASSLAAKMQQASKAPAKTEVATSAKGISSAKSLPVSVTEATTNIATPTTRKAVKKAPPTGEWTLIGEGTYRDDLMTRFDDVELSQWKVPVYKNGDWYRLAPYAVEDTPLANLLGEVDDSEDAVIYINASDPTKVYAEDFIVYGMLLFSNYTEETDWEGAEGYGKLEDGIISWAPTTSMEDMTWAYYDGNSFYVCSYQTVGVAVALPGYDLPDYTLDFTAPIYTDTNEVTVTLNPGHSLDKIAYVVLNGVYSTSDEANAQVVAEYGDRVSNSPVVSLAIELNEGNGIYSIMMVGLDESEKVKSERTVYIVLHNHEGENWVAAGTTEFTEGVYSADYNIDPQTYTVNIEQDENNPGHIRLVNAFTACPLFQEAEVLSDDEADNNLYIDMSNPKQVAALPSVTGIDLGNGNGILCSFSYLYLSQFEGDELKEAQEELEFYGYFGTVDEDGLLTIPMYTLELSERDYENGAFVDSSGEIAFQLPEEVLGVKDIIATDSAAPAVYYNLQGVRVDNPAKGGIYIRTQAGKASKVAF